jgi:hypothetical protein
LTKLKCEAGHVEFVEINIIMQLKASWAQHAVENWLVRKWPFSPSASIDITYIFIVSKCSHFLSNGVPNVPTEE